MKTNFVMNLQIAMTLFTERAAGRLHRGPAQYTRYPSHET